LSLRFVPSFTGHTSGIGGLGSVDEKCLTHLRRVPFTHLSMSSGQKKNCSDISLPNLTFSHSPVYVGAGVLVEFRTILATHFFLVTALIAQHDLALVLDSRAMCQSRSFTVDSWTAVTCLIPPSKTGGEDGITGDAMTSGASDSSSSAMTGREATLETAARLNAQGRE
jgi:hypothetical protein